MLMGHNQNRAVRNLKMMTVLALFAIISAACAFEVEEPAWATAHLEDEGVGEVEVDPTTATEQAQGQPEQAVAAPTTAAPTTTAPAPVETAPAETESIEAEPVAAVEPVEEVPVTISPDVTIPAASTELASGNVAYGGGQGGGSLASLLDVTLPTINGEPVEVDSFLGQDVVLWFWAPWCAWCNAEAPRVSQIASEFEDEVQIVGVAGVSDPHGMEDFVDRHDLEHITHVADFSGDFWRSLDVTYQPWWMFVNDDGQIISNWQGRLSEEEIRELVTELQDL